MASQPILICYDGSGDAGHAIDTAASLLGSRRAVVLDVEPFLTTAESFAAINAVVPGSGFEELNEAQAREKAQEGAALAERAGFSAEARGWTASSTWEGIVGVADEIDAAVIVMGSRGLDGARELVEGSISHEVAEHAGRPVLIVPPPNDR
jgi:nucleotide-binding universal stress UspA family protein